MAAADSEEYKRLESVVLELTTLLASASPEAKKLLLNGIAMAQKQIETLKYELERVEKRVQADRTAAIEESVQRETALNADEKSVFSNFLKKDYFTKSDFGQLETFYSKSWDKLSDGGKDEMTERLNKGVDRGEYVYSELPTIVQEKEAARRGEKSPGQVKQGVAPLPVGDIDLTSIDLSGVELTDGPAPSSGAIPRNEIPEGKRTR